MTLLERIDEMMAKLQELRKAAVAEQKLKDSGGSNPPGPGQPGHP